MWRPSVQNSIFFLSVRLFVCLFLYYLIYCRTFIFVHWIRSATSNKYRSQSIFRSCWNFRIVKSLNQLVVVRWLSSIKWSNPFSTVPIFMDLLNRSILVLIYFHTIYSHKINGIFSIFSLQILLHQQLQYKQNSRDWRVFLCESWLISLLSFFYEPNTTDSSTRKNKVHSTKSIQKKRNTQIREWSAKQRGSKE